MSIIIPESRAVDMDASLELAAVRAQRDLYMAEHAAAAKERDELRMRLAAALSSANVATTRVSEFQSGLEACLEKLAAMKAEHTKRS